MSANLQHLSPTLIGTTVLVLADASKSFIHNLCWAEPLWLGALYFRWDGGPVPLISASTPWVHVFVLILLCISPLIWTHISPRNVICLEGVTVQNYCHFQAPSTHSRFYRVWIVSSEAQKEKFHPRKIKYVFVPISNCICFIFCKFISGQIACLRGGVCLGAQRASNGCKVSSHPPFLALRSYREMVAPRGHKYLSPSFQLHFFHGMKMYFSPFLQITGSPHLLRN